MANHRGKRLIANGDQRRYTGEILHRTRPKTYRAIVMELAEPNASVNGIARRYRVSNHTVMGIRELARNRIPRFSIPATVAPFTVASPGVGDACALDEPLPTVSRKGHQWPNVAANTPTTRAKGYGSRKVEAV